METNGQLIMDQDAAANKTKKKVDTIEKVFIGLFLLGMFLKLMGWYGGSLFLMIGMSFWSFLLFFKAILTPILYKFQGPTGTAYPALILMRVGGSILVMGALFKILYWIGWSMPLFLLGPILASVGLVLAYFAYTKIAAFSVARTEIIKTLLMMLTGALIYYIPAYTLYSYTGTYRNDEHYMRLLKTCREEHKQCDSLNLYGESLWKIKEGTENTEKPESK